MQDERESFLDKHFQNLGLMISVLVGVLVRESPFGAELEDAPFVLEVCGLHYGLLGRFPTIVAVGHMVSRVSCGRVGASSLELPSLGGVASGKEREKSQRLPSTRASSGFPMIGPNLEILLSQIYFKINPRFRVYLWFRLPSDPSSLCCRLPR